MASAALYDAAQVVLGARRSRARVAALLDVRPGDRVVDVGAGTGGYAVVVPETCDYVAVDVDLERLERLRKSHPTREAIHASATSLPFPDESFDVAMCIAVAHHLSNDDLARVVDEMSRVAKRLVLLDPLASNWPTSRVLWLLDAGSYPRSAEQLVSVVSPRFDVTHVERFRTIHAYVICCGDRRATAQSERPNGSRSPSSSRNSGTSLS